MDYYLGDNFGEREGIGDFLCKFPAIDYYTLDLNEKLYIHTRKRFECLLPKRENLIISEHGKPFNVPFIRESHPYHPTGGWLPKINKFEGNFTRKHENFYYPKIEYSKEVENFIKNKYKFDKKIITYIRTTSDPNRNWKEKNWDILIKKLSKDFICIEVGAKNSIKNSKDYYLDGNSISLGDDLDLYQLSHLIKLSHCFLSLDTGFLHVAVAIQCRKIIVLMNNGDKSWFYPNNIVFDVSNNRDIIDEILKEVYD